MNRRTRMLHAIKRMRPKAQSHHLNPFAKKHREFFTNVWENDLRTTIPSVNIREYYDYYNIEMAVPGFHKEDLQVKVEGNHLTICCMKDNKKITQGNGYLRREFNYSKFSRTFAIPEYADVLSIDSTYADGILSVIIPRKK